MQYEFSGEHPSTRRFSLRPLSAEDALALHARVNLGDLRAVLPAETPRFGDIIDGSTPACAFSIMANDVKDVVGLTALDDVDRRRRRAALGSIWASVYSDAALVRGHTIYLLLKFSFDALDCRRVELKADARDAQLRQTLRRLGFMREGTLRSYETGSNAIARDITVWSVIDKEWRWLERRLLAAMDVQNWPWKDGLPMILPSLGRAV